MPRFVVDVRVEFVATRTDPSKDMVDVEGWDPYHQGDLVDGRRTCIFEKEVRDVEADDSIKARAAAPALAGPLVADGWTVRETERWSDVLTYEQSEEPEASSPTP